MASSDPGDSSGSWAGIDVKRYASAVIESVVSNPSNPNVTIYAYASSAAAQGLASEKDAGRLAAVAVRRHGELVSSGVPVSAAKEQAAQEMTQRFDSRARDTQAKERSRGAGQEV